MRKGLGVICIVFSVLLLVKGHDVGASVVSRVKQMFAGVPLDAAMKLDLAGIGLGLLGLLLIFWKRK
jgi:hypothetical protein